MYSVDIQLSKYIGYNILHSTKKFPMLSWDSGTGIWTDEAALPVTVNET